MRHLLDSELYALDDNCDSEDGAIAFEATVKELADLDTGTACGSVGNSCFKALDDHGYGSIMCRGWIMMTPAKTLASNLKAHANPDSFYNHSSAEACFNRLAKGNNKPEVQGMFHMQIPNEEIAIQIMRIVDHFNGSLQFSGDSRWQGYKEFEIE